MADSQAAPFFNARRSQKTVQQDDDDMTEDINYDQDASLAEELTSSRKLSNGNKAAGKTEVDVTG